VLTPVTRRRWEQGRIRDVARPAMVPMIQTATTLLPILFNTRCPQTKPHSPLSHDFFSYTPTSTPPFPEIRLGRYHALVGLAVEGPRVQRVTGMGRPRNCEMYWIMKLRDRRFRPKGYRESSRKFVYEPSHLPSLHAHPGRDWTTGDPLNSVEL
jgi:hypothetical protein